MTATFEHQVAAADLVDAARSYIGGRFSHAGRSRGGLDCIGLVVLPCSQFGIKIHDEELYSRKPTPSYFLRRLREEFVEIPVDTPIRAGLVGFFWIQRPRLLRHIALFSGPRSMVHSFSDPTAPRGGLRSSVHRHVGKVDEVPFGMYWRQRLAHLFEIPGVV